MDNSVIVLVMTIFEAYHVRNYLKCFMNYLLDLHEGKY